MTVPPSLPATLAMLSPDCDVAASPLQCRLDSILNFLDVAAVLLAILLVLVLVVAWRSWQQNRKSAPRPDTQSKNKRSL